MTVALVVVVAVKVMPGVAVIETLRPEVVV